jgi:hypothetical protein
MPRATFAFLGFLALLLAACESKSLTGAEAQQAFRDGRPALASRPDGPLVFLNGAPLAPGSTLDDLDPAMITRIEVIKGQAAREHYGPDADRGVILVFASDSATVARLTTP